MSTDWAGSSFGWVGEEPISEVGFTSY